MAGRISLYMEEDLLNMLRLRAKRNNRSLNQETVYLIETAIAMKSDQVRDTLHMLLKAQGEGYPTDAIEEA